MGILAVQAASDALATRIEQDGLDSIPAAALALRLLAADPELARTNRLPAPGPARDLRSCRVRARTADTEHIWQI